MAVLLVHFALSSGFKIHTNQIDCHHVAVVVVVSVFVLCSDKENSIGIVPNAVCDIKLSAN